MYYEYKIKSGDTFSGIIHSMFGRVSNDTRYVETVRYLLALNPQIKNPDRIRADDMLRLGVLPITPQVKPPAIQTPAAFITHPPILAMRKVSGHSPGWKTTQITSPSRAALPQVVLAIC